jgi:hypothetical protein
MAEAEVVVGERREARPATLVVIRAGSCAKRFTGDVLLPAGRSWISINLLSGVKDKCGFRLLFDFLRDLTGRR